MKVVRNEPKPVPATYDLMGLSEHQAIAIKTYLAHTHLAGDDELRDLSVALDKAGVRYYKRATLVHTNPRGSTEDAELDITISGKSEF